MKSKIIRMNEDQAKEVQLMARIEGTSEAELIRRAIGQYLASRRADPEFQTRLRERIAADKKILDRLKTDD